MELKHFRDWQSNSSPLPARDCYCAVVFRHSANANRTAVAFYSTDEGFILPPTFSDYKPFVLAWYPLPAYPDWLVDDVPF